MIKTLFDKIGAVVALVPLLPALLLIWLVVTLTSKGGGFYGHTRIGKNCKPFTLYKFRSMVAGADEQGYQTQVGDARITTVGKFLRKTSLDELPQLFNVLKGDMSLVGPRPDTPMQEKDYTPQNWQLRHSVRPGITGLAQVNGRSNISTEDRLAYDLQYAASHTLGGDLLIILRTLCVAMGKSTN